MLGGAVNSDAGITGQLTIDEPQLISRVGQPHFEICLVERPFGVLARPSVLKRLRVAFSKGTRCSLPIRTCLDIFPSACRSAASSMIVDSMTGTRSEWEAVFSFGYRITPDLSISAGVTGQNVDITDARDETVLADILGDNGLWSGEVSLKHDTRNTPIQASEGHYFEFSFEEVFGDYEYSRFEVEARQYWLLNERADGSR